MIALHGDCLDLMQDIADESIDMILCDLPYGVTARNAWDTQIPLEPLWDAYKRIIKPNGAIVLTAIQPFSSQLVMSNPKWFKYEWVWVKTQKTNFLNAKKQPLRQHEQVLVFYKEQPTYNPQGVVPFNGMVRQGKKNTDCYNNLDREDGIYYKENCNYPVDVLHFKSAVAIKNIIPTQKPVDLFAYLIKTYTNEGDTVLDNCAGSFTTGVACKQTKRNYYLMEKNQENFEKGMARLNG